MIERSIFEPLQPFALIKIGGSLLDWPELPTRMTSFLEALGEDSSRVVILVGGGKMVDVIRGLDETHRLGDVASHWMAIKALDLTAEILTNLLPRSSVVSDLTEISSAWKSGLTPILAPYRLMVAFEDESSDKLPASWEVTSDSIAAWLAVRLGAERLILLKSADIPEETSRSRAAALGLVDSFFPNVSRDIHRVECLNLRDSSARLIPLVEGE